MLTRDSRIGEIYATPIGHDIIHTLLLQTGLPGKGRRQPCGAPPFTARFAEAGAGAGWTTAWWIPCWAC